MMELSTQFLIREAWARDVTVEVLDAGDNFIRLRRDDRTEYVKQATKTSADTYVTMLIMENKRVTKALLAEQGIRVPEGISLDAGSDMGRVLARFRPRAAVIKPNSTNFGQGVMILQPGYTAGEADRALKQALEWDDTVLMEEFIPGLEYRFLVIGDEVAAVLRRIPANVTGDGRSMIRDLVKMKNEDPLRGEGYVTPLEKIRIGEVETEYLSRQGLTPESVPPDGQTVYLRENSNISTGGDSLDLTDEIPERFKEIAVRAAKTAGARICGVDMMIDGEDYGIIELNFNPALHIHDAPWRGQNRGTAGKVLDLLGFTKKGKDTPND